MANLTQDEARKLAWRWTWAALGLLVAFVLLSAVWSPPWLFLPLTGGAVVCLVKLRRYEDLADQREDKADG